MSAGTATVAVNLLDARSLLSSWGAIGIFAVLVAETGLLIGIVLPGDSLLFTAGILCTTGHNTVHLSLPQVLIAACAGALVGAQLGYLLGRKAGPPLLERRSRPGLRRAVERSSEWLERYGSVKAVVLARFIPGVRTIVNPLAGVVRMPVRTFTIAQCAGGLVWALGVTLAGYWLGKHVPSIDNYLLPIVAVVVILSLIPVLLEARRARSGSRS
jgi:membrane-associated protein